MSLRLSAGLSSLLLCTLFLALSLGLVPDRDGAVIEGRKSFCEAMAVHYALAAQEDDKKAIQVTTAAVRRHPDLLSFAVRGADGRVTVEVGEHRAHWGLPPGDTSTPTEMRVPLTRRVKGAPREERWGHVEFRFRPLAGSGLPAPLSHPALPLILFVVGAGLLTGTAYLWLTARKLDAKRPKVVPDRVRATLNTVVEGVLVLDRDQKIVLANEAFARTLGRSAAELQGQPSSALPWADLEGQGPPPGEPWARAMEQAAPLRGVALGLRSADAGLRRVSVNATPILDDHGACLGALVTIDDLTAVERNNAWLRKLLHRLRASRRKIRQQNRELKEALARVKQLQGLLPICSYCKRIRDDQNYWQRVEAYIGARTDAQFSHGICPDCFDHVVRPEVEQMTG